MSALDYKYRPDGNFLVRCKCAGCGEGYDVHAMANADPNRKCPACEQVEEWMRAQQRR